MEKTKTNTIFKLFGSFAFLILANLFSSNVYAEHSISVSTSGSQDINVLATTGVAISEAKVDVATTCHAGYNLTLSTTVDDNNLYLNGDESYRDNHLYFSPSNGTSSLSESDNTWGYYLPSSSTDIPTSSSIFNAVPTTGQIVSLRTPAQTSRNTDINDSISVFYGVKASSSMVAGTYTLKNDTDHNTGSLIYYATLPEDCFKYTVEYNPTGTNTGIAVTGTGTVENQTIAEGITDNLTTDVYGDPTIDGITYYFVGWNTAQDGSGVQYSSGQSVADLVTAGETLILYAQWTPCLSGQICYLNNKVNAEGSMGNQTLISTDTSKTLLSSNYSLEGYGFAGWNTSYDYTGDFYGPNETISFDAGQYTDGNEGLSLYAVWIKSDGTIQDWEGCNNLPAVSYNSLTGALAADLSNIIALTDSRDNQTYAIAKLTDGKCWMIENLRLSSEYSRRENASELSQGYGQSELHGNFIGLANSENNSFSDTAAPNSLYSTNNSTTININTIDSPNYRIPRYNDTNITNRSANFITNNTNNYSYGNYYNWPAAMANTYYYTSGYIENGQESDKSNQANTSLCPSGWRMPYGSEVRGNTYDGDLAKLDIAMGGSGLANSINSVLGISMSYYWRKFPNNIVYSGNTTGSTIDNRGINAYLWTTTASSSQKSYGFSVGSSYLNPGVVEYEKYYGFSVRCIIDD